MPENATRPEAYFGFGANFSGWRVGKIIHNKKAAL